MEAKPLTTQGLTKLRGSIERRQAGPVDCHSYRIDAAHLLATIDQAREREVAYRDSLAALANAVDAVAQAEYADSKVRTQEDHDNAAMQMRKADSALELAYKNACGLLEKQGVPGIRGWVMGRVLDWLRSYATEQQELGKDHKSSKEWLASTTRAIAIRAAATSMEKTLRPEVVRGD